MLQFIFINSRLCSCAIFIFVLNFDLIYTLKCMEIKERKGEKKALYCIFSASLVISRLGEIVALGMGDLQTRI